MESPRVIIVYRLHYYRIYQCLFVLISSLYSQNREAVPAGELLQEKPFRQLIVNMDFKDTAMKDIVRLLATRYGLNIFIDDRITVRLTLHLVNVSVGDALIFMVEDNGLILEKIGSIYKISQAPPAPELPSPPHPWKINYQDGLLSVDFTGEDIREALLQISRITGRTILMDRSVSGEITGFIQSLPFREAMFQLLRSAGFIFKKEGDVYQVRRMIHETSSGNNSPNFWISSHQELIDMEISDAP